MADDKPTYRVPRTPYNSREIDLGERKDSRIPSRYGDLIFRRFDKFLIPTPTGLSATEGDVNVSLTWNSVSHHAVDGYNVYIEGQDDPLNSSIITNNAYTVSGLNANTDYDFVVTAITNTGNESSRSSPVTATYDPPPAQPIITTISESDSQIDVQWSANSESDLAGYNIYLDGTKHNSSLITAESYSFTGLNNGQNYLIELEAVDNAGSASPKDSVTGTPAIQSVNNYSAEFDGVDDRIIVGGVPSHNELTIEFWIYPRNFSSIKGLFSSRTDLIQIDMYIDTTGEPYLFSVNSSGNSTELRSSQSLSTSTWQHIAISFASTGRTMYIDGSQVASDSNDSKSMSELEIGSVNGNYIMEGLIDDFRYWSSVRTQSEIQNNMSTELSGTESSLAGYWKLNEGLPLAYDKAGGNQGTVNGGLNQSTDVPFSDDNRYSTVFDGVDDEINLGDSSSLRPNTNFPQSMTVEFWFKADSNISDSGRFWLLGKGSSSANDSIHTDISNGKVIFYLDTVDKTGNVDILTSYSKDRWYHLALVYDGSEVRVYIDGNLEVTDTGFGGNIADASGSPWTIGYRQGTGYYYYGQIDDVRIWNEAKTQTQIQNNYQSELNGNEQGLVAYWTFDEYVEDLTANNNHGLLKGNVGYSVDTPFVTEFTSHSLSFDGQDDEVDVGTGVMDFSGNTDFTVECWINTSYANQDNNYILGTDLGFGWYMRIDYGISSAYALLTKIDDDTNDAYDTGFTALNDGKWHHIAMVVDGGKGTLKGYVDGLLEISMSQSVGDMLDTFKIGTTPNQNGDNQLYEGLIDEVRVWNKALTGSEIRDSMKKDLSDLTNIIGYWKFDEGSGSTATDETGNNDGTINGATYSTDTPD